MKSMEIYKPTSIEMARKLLAIDAVRLNEKEPFVWSSGWHAPIYCDNRLTLSYPDIRLYIKKALAAAITARFGGAEYVAGVATAGISHGALVADTLGLPYVYVRHATKEHGMRNRIEGRIEAGKRVVLVEDLVSTCGSSLRAAEALTEAGFSVVGIVAIFTYGFAIASKRLEAARIPLLCLSSFDDVVAVGLENGYLDKSQLDRLASWKASPDTWH